MKLNITNIIMAFFILLAASGCAQKRVTCTAVNTYAVEKTRYYKKNDIGDKIINETEALYMPYPFSLKMLLISKDTFSSQIPLADIGIMSEEYYVNKYIKEQDLVQSMFKKRNTFTNLHVEYVDEINTPLKNDKKYDYVMYFDTSTLGELDIYLKDNSTNTTFLIWNIDTTKIDPIEAVEKILKNKLMYCAHLKHHSVNSNTSNTKVYKPSLKSITKKTTVPTKPVVKLSSKVQIIKETSMKDTIVRASSKVETIKNISQKKSMPKTFLKTKRVNKINYKDITREYNGCFAYGIFNQCLVR